MLYLSSVQELFPKMYLVGAASWFVLSVLWCANTLVNKSARGIDLQWHFSLFVTMKPINFLYKFLFWEVVRVGKGDRHFYMVLTLSINCLYYCILWETMMRVSQGWMIVKHRLSSQSRFHVYMSLVIWAFGNFIFSYFYQFQGEGFGIVKTDLAVDIVAYYLVAFALLATGISYTIILMTVKLLLSSMDSWMWKGAGLSIPMLGINNRFWYGKMGVWSVLKPKGPC